MELLDGFVDIIDSGRTEPGNGYGLTDTEIAFYNIPVMEVGELSESDILTEEQLDAIKTTTQDLVAMFNEATEIVDFFQKQDEVKRMKKEIKRAVLDQPYGEPSLVKILQERFMDLARARFGK